MRQLFVGFQGSTINAKEPFQKKQKRIAKPKATTQKKILIINFIQNLKPQKIGSPPSCWPKSLCFFDHFFVSIVFNNQILRSAFCG